MIDELMKVDRWSADKRPPLLGAPDLWSCTLELRSARGRLSFGLDVSEAEAERLSALVARGSVRLSEIFGVENG